MNTQSNNIPNPIQTLDLSKFGHIINPSEQDERGELERRSKAIQAIRDLMENLAKALESYVGDLATFDSKIKMLNQRAENLKEAEYQVSQKEQEVYALEEEVKREREYVVLATGDMKARETKVLEQQNLLEKIREETVLFEKRKAEAIQEEGRLAKTRLDIREEKLRVK